MLFQLCRVTAVMVLEKSIATILFVRIATAAATGQ